MSGTDGILPGQIPQALHGFLECCGITAGEIGPAHTELEQGIPGEENLFFFNIVTAGTDGVSRCFKYFPCKSGDGKLIDRRCTYEEYLETQLSHE